MLPNRDVFEEKSGADRYGTNLDFEAGAERNAVVKTCLDVNFGGSDQEIAQWFETNKDSLTFDKESKKFIVE